MSAISYGGGSADAYHGVLAGGCTGALGVTWDDTATLGGTFAGGQFGADGVTYCDGSTDG